MHLARLWLQYDDGTQLDAPVSTINAGCGRQEHHATVFVDGSQTINHYSIECQGDWITVSRIRNSVTLVISDNTSPYERFGTVRFTHNLDADTHMTLIFIQAAPEYSVAVSKDGEEVSEVVFSALCGKDDQDSETEPLDVECVGGTEDYTVRGVLEYYRASENLSYRAVPYDGGLKVVKVGPSQVSITSYGKVARYGDMYYDVVLAHRNSPRATARIRVRYAEAASDGGFSLEG